MDPVITEWVGLLIRWAHVMAGIAWIGSSFFFIFLDASLRKREHTKEGVAGESWMVHGGGFYLMEKYLVAPESLPKELHWFKYEAYFTWITGMLLLAVIYYLSAEAFLIDPSVMELSPGVAIGISAASIVASWVIYDLLCRSPVGKQTGPLAAAVFLLILAAAWGYGEVFSGRAAFIHVGVMVGSIMVGNVFFIIIPNQKVVVDDLKAGRTPAASLGAQAKQRSLHNNYLTLPVVLMMISNHYPVTYGHEQAWLIVGGVVVFGGLVRHHFNLSHAGGTDRSKPFLIPGSLAVLALLVAFTLYRPEVTGEAEPVDFAEVDLVIKNRCASCHADNPTDEDFDAPPGEVAFDQPRQIKANAQRILTQSVLTDAMPLGNKTGMLEEERALLGAWIRQGAPIE